MIPLGLAGTGSRSRIIEVRGPKDVSGSDVIFDDAAEKASTLNQERRSNKSAVHLEDLGLRNGKIVEMIKNEGREPLLLKIDGNRIALSRGLAMKIMVVEESVNESGATEARRIS